ncbi:MAG: hypothetical protein CMP23_02140 [Rickettsiales bacterium]|nr:hypothetical protein [Rickettsiales bacterium]
MIRSFYPPLPSLPGRHMSRLFAHLLFSVALFGVSAPIALAEDGASTEADDTEPPPPASEAETGPKDEVELDEELDEDFDAVLEEGVDSEGIFQDYRDELRGEDPIEEADAWKNYLDAYPRSLYRLEIETRIEALEQASFDDLELEDRNDQQQQADESNSDAKRADLDIREPALLGMNANTRRRVDVGILWGFQDYFNYEVGVEWAFKRQFSAFGTIRHSGKGFGTAVQAGAKYALIKDTRTGTVLSGAFSINLGYSALEQLNFVIQPWIGFGWIANDLIQLQTSLAMDLRVDRLRTAVLWDFMVLISATQKLGVYFQSKQRHSLVRPEGQPVRYLGFHQAGVGVKVRPTPLIELTVGANIPYGWNHWKDYRYFGVHAGLVFYFKKQPLE